MRFRDLFSSGQQGSLARLMQAVIALILLVGIYRGSPGIAVNSLVSLLVTFLPAILERDYEISMSPAIVSWITLAVFLHAVGTLGPYGNVWWWDHVTHMFSSSIVAGAGYAALRSFDEHLDRVELPERFIFLFILVFVMAFGVIWEVIEFLLGEAAVYLGSMKVLTQYGLEDTMKDLMFDLAGGAVVATVGEAYLTGVIDSYTERLEKLAREF